MCLSKKGKTFLYIIFKITKNISKKIILNSNFMPIKEASPGG